MSTNDLIGWGAFVVVLMGLGSLYHFIVSPGGRLDRLLGDGRFGLEKVERESRRWRDLQVMLGRPFVTRGRRFKLGPSYFRRPDAYLVSMVMMRRANEPGGRSTQYRNKYLYMSDRPTGLEGGFTVSVKATGLAGKMMRKAMERMGVEPDAGAEVLPEFGERFWIFDAEPPGVPPGISRELQEAFLRQTRSTWAHSGASRLLAGGTGVHFAPQGFAIDFGARIRISLDHLREVLELADALRDALDAGRA